MFELFYVACWFMSNPVVHWVLLRYLFVQAIPSLWASQALVRFVPLIALLITLIIKIGFWRHPTMNSPHLPAQPFNFSLGLIFLGSMFSSIGLVLSIYALSLHYVHATKFLALYYAFETLFRMMFTDMFLTRHIERKLGCITFLMLVLVFLIVCYFNMSADYDVNHRVTDRSIYFSETFYWRGVVSILFAALSNTIGSLLWKYNQFTVLMETKDVNDQVSWANFIKDEPEKIEQTLCVQNRIMSRFYEAQLRCFHQHTTFRELPIEELNEHQLRTLIATYMHRKEVYTYQDMEPYYQQMKEDKDYINYFGQEAVDDPEFYQTETDKDLFKKLIKELVYQLQLDSQKHQELFSTDKYRNFIFESIFDDYTLDSEYLWKNTQDTFYLNLFKMSFESFICFFLAFYNLEFQNEDLWKQGFNMGTRSGHELSETSFYCVLVLLMGFVMLMRPLSIMKMLAFMEPAHLFFFRMFAELLVLFIALLWIDYTTVEQESLAFIALIITFLGQGYMYHMTMKAREDKEKAFYIKFLGFLTQNQKYTLKEGFQMNTMLGLCAQKMSLLQFLRVYAQVAMSHGIQSPDQLRQLRFMQPYLEMRDVYVTDTSIRKKLWDGGVPFIFSPYMKYENNTDGYQEPVDEDMDDGWKRVVLQSAIMNINYHMQKNIDHHQSASLWNYTLSPGWTEQEVSILKKALMRFGIGKWRKIINSQCLPGKSIGQIYMQTQRLLGQQSLGEFMGLSVDMERVYLRNMARKNEFRKNNIIINTGDNMTQEQRAEKIKQNKEQFGVSLQEIQKIKLPRYHITSQSSFLTLDEIDRGKFTTIEKLIYISQLSKDIVEKSLKIDRGELTQLNYEEPQKQKKRRALPHVVVDLVKVKKGFKVR